MQLPKYGIPKSTLHLYEIGKIELEARPGPLSILTTVISLRMLKAVPPVTVVGVTVVLSVAFLPESCGLHVIHVTDGFMQSVPMLILTILATSTMWTGCV